MSLLDRARAVRRGEELDANAVATFLRGVDASLAGTPEIEQFPGGASNLTYLLRFHDRELVLRRPPFGKRAKSAHDMTREARIMQQLGPVYPYVPKIIAICADERVIGAEFFVMERISGIIPRKDLPEGLLLDAAQTRTLCLNVLDRLVDLHQIDPRTAGLSDLGKGDGYVARQVSGWSDRFRRARTADVGDFESVMAWLADKQPTHDAASRVIHNDYRFDNVVLDPADPLRVIGVLDWEMCTIGDPLMDLGNSLAYWVEAGDDAVRQMTRRQPTHLPGMLTRSEVIAYYADKTGLPVDNVDFYATFGLFRLAGIVQQIYYRYYHKQTDNPAFAGFGDIVRYLEGACLKAIG